MDLAEALSIRKPVAPSPLAVPRPGQPPMPAQQMPQTMPQPMAQMPGMAQGMPYQPPQQALAGMPGMGVMSPYGQTNSGQSPLRFARGGSVSIFAVNRKAR